MNPKITYEESKALVLALMVRRKTLTTSEIGYAAFPDAKFKSPQGAARAAGRIIKRLMEDGVIDFHWVGVGCVQYKPKDSIKR